MRCAVHGEAKPVDHLAGFTPLPVIITGSPLPQPPQTKTSLRKIVSSLGEYSFQTSPWSLLTFPLQGGP